MLGFICVFFIVFTVSSLKQQSVCRCVAPLTYIILIPSQLVFSQIKE
jgi:hypothetical protein